ncbi:T-cell surface glycoprotein CD1e, membrane-associated-like [Astyanax mexicanus]|uniref:T-cell surface glycoprotein CD1e, membrane-associated-like n=1 Tax=Astyanax mexicanus TaxID=7994 RepID=UPI0020CB2595|nr:T-cell surface glycoprotein CD1e, membrane-associated-like [Astyanax mexicanus]
MGESEVWVLLVFGVFLPSYGVSEPPVVSMFIDSPPPGPNLQSLTCVATGFYPKSLKMILRISGAPISEDQIKSTGVRPSGDGTYNLSKTLEVLENEKLNEYDCYVTHSSLKEPIIVHLGVHWVFWLLLSVGLLIGIIVLVCCCLCVENRKDASAIFVCSDLICSCLSLCDSV